MKMKMSSRRTKQILESLETSEVGSPRIMQHNNQEKTKMPNTTIIKTQKSGYDTASGFKEVTIGKEKEFTLPVDLSEAQAALNGDSAKLMEVIHAGLRGIFAEQLRDDETVPYRVADGNKLTDTVFSGTLLDGPAKDQFTAQVLNLAKTSARPFGSWDQKTSEEKSALKSKARTTILTNPSVFGFDFAAVSAEDAAKIED